MSDGKKILVDESAESSSEELPAFLSKPEGAPVYHGFPLIEETYTDGWCYGAITEFIEEGGCDSGDGYVQAPDGSRAGLVWVVGEFETTVVCEPDVGRWGVYGMSFPKVIFSLDDLIYCFRSVLPELINIYRKVNANNG